VTTIVAEPAVLRELARRGVWDATTAGHCPRFQQANVVLLPAEAAADFAAFCTRNPKPCPLIEITPPGDPEPRLSANGADLRTDVPAYRVYRQGDLVEKRTDIADLWRPDLVGFLLGCSHTFEHALAEAGVVVRHIACGTTVPMFVSSIQCVPAGRFEGPMVVTMRPIPRDQLALVFELSARYPHAHGVPVHVGEPERIGIGDLGRPDYGEPVPIEEGDVPVFWACGVTPQAVARVARPDLMISHEPGRMFVTDLPREALPGSAASSNRGGGV
jgi:uncharacterized protein YcsI (UPF0317 family)